VRPEQLLPAAPAGDAARVAADGTPGYDRWTMIGAIILGLLAGFIARALMPGRQISGILATLLLGLGGAIVGFLIFTELLGIGDTEAFDLGGLPGAVIGSMVLLFLYERFIASRQ
jgi:uncharacterized membrane protein YeaQ/YmgE (transglycosylase-associated protein family)